MYVLLYDTVVYKRKEVKNITTASYKRKSVSTLTGPSTDILPA